MSTEKERKDPLEQSDEDLINSEDEQTKKKSDAKAGVKALLARGSANEKLKSALKKLQETKAKTSGQKDEVKPKLIKKTITKVEKPKLLKQTKEKTIKLIQSKPLLPSKKILKTEKVQKTVKMDKVVKNVKVQKVFGFCDVCFQVEVDLKKEGNKLLKCNGCNKKAHQRCIGLTTDSFECLGCATKSDVPCIVCGHDADQSLYAKVSEDCFAHYICALFCDKIEVIDFKTLQFQLSSDANLKDGLLESLAEDGDIKCELCQKSTGTLFRCLKRHCKKKTHMFCLQQQRKGNLINEVTNQNSQEESDSEPEDEIAHGWLFDLKVQDYLGVKYLSSRSNDLQEPLIQHFDFFNIEKRGNNRNFKDYNEQLQFISPVNSPSKLLQDQETKAIAELKPIKTVQNRHPPRINMPLRGGKVSLICEDHRNDYFCFCDHMKTQSMSMIMCEYCMIWFHSKCEGLTALQAQNIEQYKCQRCKEWEKKVKNLILPVLDNITIEDATIGPDPISKQFCNWDSWKQSVLPNAKYRKLSMNLSEIFLIAAMWQEQVMQIVAGTALVNAELLKQQLVQAQYIPLNLSYTVAQLNNFVEKLVIFQEQNESCYQSYTIELVMNSDGIIDTEALSKNKDTSLKVKTLIDQESEQFHILSFKAQQLQSEVINQIEIINQCVMVFQNDDQIEFEQFVELKDQLNPSLQPELASKIKTLYWRARKWLAFADECLDKLKHQGDLVKSNESKKSVTDAKDLIACVENFQGSKQPAFDDDLRKQISFRNKVQLLKDHIRKTEEWDKLYTSYTGDLTTLLSLYEDQKSLQLKSQSTTDLINLIATNKSWFEDSTRFISAKFRPHGKPQPKPSREELVQTLQKLGLLKTNKLAQQMVVKLQDVQKVFDELKIQANNMISGKTNISSLAEVETLLNQIRDIKVQSEMESQLQNLLNAFQWSPANPFYISYESLRHFADSLQLAEQLKDEFRSKLQKIDVIFDEIRQLKQDMLIVIEPLTLGSLKSTIQQVCKLIEIKENLMLKFKIDSSELRMANLGGSADYAFSKVNSWLNRVLFHVQKLLDIRTTQQKSSKDKDGLELLPQVMKIKKQMLKSLIVDAETHCNGALSLSKVASIILKAIQEQKGAKDVETVMDEKRVSQNQLELLAEKAKKMQDIKSYESLQKQIQQAKEWYVDFDKIKMNDQELRTNLRKDSDSVTKLLTQANDLIKRKQDIKLETRQGDNKIIHKIQKFCSMLLDSRQLLLKQEGLTFERFQEIAEQLKTLSQMQFQSLKSYTDICEFKAILAEALKYEMFEEDIEQIIKLKPYDTEAMKQRIQRVYTELKVDAIGGTKPYLDQIESSEQWTVQSDKEEDANMLHSLLKQYELKQNDSLILVSMQSVQVVKTKFIKALFKPQNEKFLVNDFVLKIREVLNDELAKNPAIQKEMEVYELARKVRSLLWENKNGKGFDSQASWKLISVEEAQIIVKQRQDLPYRVPDHLIDKINEQLTSYKQLESSATQLLSQKPQLETIKPIYEDLKAILLDSQLSKDLQRMLADNTFLETLWKQIESSKNIDIIFEASQLKKASKIIENLRFKCDYAEKITEFYNEQLEVFSLIKQDFEKGKGSMTLVDINDFTQRLKSLKIDFDLIEAAIRSELWHIKLQITFKELDADSDEQSVESEILRYWLEEGTELELTKDEKYERLNDLVEDVDEVIKIVRNCFQIQEIDDVIQVVVTQISKKIDFTRIVEWAKNRINNGEVKEIKWKGNHSCPAEYLKMYLKKKVKQDEDFEMSENNLIESDTDDSELIASDEETKKPLIKPTGLAASLKQKSSPGIPKLSLAKPSKLGVVKPALKVSKKLKEKKEKVPVKKREQKAIDKEEKSVELTAAQIERQKKLQAMKERLIKKPDEPKPNEALSVQKTAVEQPKVETKIEKPKLAEKPKVAQKPKVEKPKLAEKAKVEKPKVAKKAKAQDENKDQEEKQEDAQEELKDKPSLSSVKIVPKIGVLKPKLNLMSSKNFASPDKPEEKTKQENQTPAQDNCDAETSVGEAKSSLKKPQLLKKPLIGFKRPAPFGGMKGLGQTELSDEMKKKLFS